MNISLHWVNRYLDRPVAAAEAEHALTFAGFPIESREELDGGDVRLDVEVTSNRGDVLSHVGVAREIAASTGRVLKLPAWTEPRGGAAGEGGELVRVENRETTVCPLFTVRVIRGVKIGPSPAWMADALRAVGQRP